MTNQNNAVTIQLLAFSGRPNPTWIAKQGFIEEIAKSLKGSEEKTYKGELPFPQLGYQGFTITSPDKSANLPDFMRIYRGILFVGSGKSRNLEDTIGLEKRLIEEAKKEGLGEILEKLGL